VDPKVEDPTEDRRPDIVLVRPRDFGAVPPGAPVQDPLGVGLLAAGLRQSGYNVLILDAHALGVDDDGLVACLAELRPPIVGLSLHSFSDYSHCVAISKALRGLPEPPYCMWGGEHATFHAERILRQHPEVDAVVLGEGEATVAELAERLLRGPDGVRPRYLPNGALGAVVRGANGEPVEAGYRRAVEDLDALPDAHKDVVELALRMGKEVSVSVLTGRGCTHSCRFCTANTFMRLGGGVVWRRRSPRAVADEVERLAKRYLSHPLVHPVLQFQDVIFLGTSPASKRWVSEYIEEMERRALRIPFYCMARADAIIANEPMLPRLVDIGLWSVEMGLESGVDRILKAYNKRNAAADNEHAVALLRQHGITFDASGFIMFDPQMTLDELRVNARYLARFGAATWDFFVTRLQLYPGTEVREEMIRKGAFDGEDNIGRTSGYAFDDPLVGLVAEHAFYYDMSIRTLDLALRDAKAALADQVRRGKAGDGPLADAVNLVHETYCTQLLALADLAEAGTLQAHVAELVSQFMGKVMALTDLLHDLLRWNDNVSHAA
jgi:anaerobic magnesium-protoporphyrin IX monomethyl ester cyclase